MAFVSHITYNTYIRTCSSYGCFNLRAMRLSNKLFEQVYARERLKSSLRKLYCQYVDLIKQYEDPPLTNHAK